MLISILFICGSILSIILVGVNQFKFGSQLASANQVSNLSHLFVRQQAKLIALMLSKNANTEELSQALTLFSKEEFVVDASLYSTSGNLLAQSHNALAFKLLLTGEETTQKTQQIVEPIFSQQNLIGFLRVTFNADYIQTSKNKVSKLFHKLYGELIILFLTGALFIGSIHYFFRKRKRSATPDISKILPKRPKLSTQRFHSRRRAFQRK